MKKNIVILLFCLALGLSGALTPVVRASSLDQSQSSLVRMVVQFSPARQVIREISFANSISGLQALEMSGLDVITKDMGWGVAVCSIGGVGCPAEDCFCDSNFWNYSSWDGSVWQSHAAGAKDTILADGAVEGWRWGPFDSGELPDARPLMAAQRALAWVARNQVQADGSYGTKASSAEALLAIGSNGLSASGWRRDPGSPSLGAYFTVYGAPYANSGVASSGKLAVGLSASQGCWPTRAKEPLDSYDPTGGAFARSSGFQAWGMLGTSALSQTVPAPAVAYLKSLALPSGGWEWDQGLGADTNTTALAVQALVAAGEPVTSTVLLDALAFIKSAQNNDGGFPYDPHSIWGTDSDGNSTAYVVQAIRAAGQDPQAAAWSISGANPISYLLGLQLEDGSFEWQAGLGSNLLTTQQAAAALMLNAHPFRQAELPACPAVYLPNIARDVVQAGR